MFFSADLEWMDYLQTRKLIQAETRHDVLGNQLVLVAPADSKVNLKIAPHFALAAALGKGRLATGDPDSVPVGRYAQQTLANLGVWDRRCQVRCGGISGIHSRAGRRHRV